MTRRQRAQADARAEEPTEEGRISPSDSEADVPREGRPSNVRPAPIPSTQEPPLHPFARARDATVPLTAPVNPIPVPALPASKRAEAAYRTAPPIYSKKFADDVFEQALDTPITITHRQLYSIAPEVRAQTREVLMGRRVPPAADVAKAPEAQLLAAEENTAEDALLLCEEIREAAHDRKYTQLVQNMPEEFARAEAMTMRSVAGDRFIVPDPYETYLHNLPPGQSPDTLTVAKESSALRSILPLIDNHLHVECIIDPGCQVIAMSEDVCHALGLAYDPDIVLNMQSANGEVDKSLGLARNVPFCFGRVTVYLQVHVIRSPAYDILLGRPFNVLTQSVIRNFMNEDQTITIHDPNSGQNATVPTFARGTRRYLQRSKEVELPGFRDSMI